MIRLTIILLSVSLLGCSKAAPPEFAEQGMCPWCGHAVVARLKGKTQGVDGYHRDIKFVPYSRKDFQEDPSEFSDDNLTPAAKLWKKNHPGVDIEGLLWACGQDPRKVFIRLPKCYREKK